MIIPGVADHGGREGTAGRVPKSRLSEYAELTVPVEPEETSAHGDGASRVRVPGRVASPRRDVDQVPVIVDAVVARRRRQFAVLLGEFRRSAVLVPVEADDAALTGHFGGVRWIYAFSGEAELARFAIARGEGDREWGYRRVLGARLLDVAVPAVGVSCGVATGRVGQSDPEGCGWPYHYIHLRHD